MSTSILARPSQFAHCRSQTGLTLVELMISITLGLLVVLAATSLVVSTKSLFITQTDGNETQDTSRFALDNISRSLRQIGFVNYDFNNSPQITPATASADIVGFDAYKVKASTTDVATKDGSGPNFSDLLAIRFFGSGAVGNGDGTMSNCAGFSVPAPVSSSTADQDRGWSIYYVANNANDEPELYCKYYNSVDNAWSAQAIAKGVESFQVLYGVDTTDYSVKVPVPVPSIKLIPATDINTLDDALVLVGATPEEKAQDKNRKTNWKKVVFIKVAILTRGKENARGDVTTSKYNLFGPDYAAANGTNDKGTTINEVDLPAGTLNKVRKVYTATVQLRNQCIVDPIKGLCLPPN